MVRAAAWLAATRPRTLGASLVPVAVGTAYAWRKIDGISWGTFALCLCFASLMQIGANFANDYYDFRRGADGQDRIGPARAVASGDIKPRTMQICALAVLSVGFVVGLFLLWVSHGGWPLLAVGVASVVCALAYTSGPWPLAYLGLGDLFVILFFGLIAVLVTHYVQLSAAGYEWEQAPWIPALGVGLVINNLLVVNNHRDAETDRLVGKLTLVARFGRRFGLVAYLMAVVFAMLVFPLLEEGLQGVLALLPAGIFLGYRLSRANDSRGYGFVFAGTAALIMLYGTFAVAGIIWL